MYTQPLSVIIERHSSSWTHSLYLISLNLTLHSVHTASICYHWTSLCSTSHVCWWQWVVQLSFSFQHWFSFLQHGELCERRKEVDHPQQAPTKWRQDWSSALWPCQIFYLPDVLRISQSDIPFCYSSRNLGVMFDSGLTMKQQVDRICQTTYFEIRRIGSIRPFLTTEATKILVTSLVLSRLDYCNSMLAGIPEKLVNKVQLESTTSQQNWSKQMERMSSPLPQQPAIRSGRLENG